MKIKRFNSSEGNVWKYVFDFKDAIAEAILYKYDTFTKRTVLCISVQSGCPVGCNFCGTGKQFIRNLTSDEIVNQVRHVLKDMNIDTDDIERFQIMFMSMGEPMLNFDNVKCSIHDLHYLYSNTELLLSTIGVLNAEVVADLITLSRAIDKVGLQFSVHEAIDTKRDELIPFKNKLTLRQIRDFGILWNQQTNRPVYINYCVTDTNQSEEELYRLMDLFPPAIFNFTFSVVCSDDETMKDKGYKDLGAINKISSLFLSNDYNVRVFNPAGQDDIGGGCGQLWYVQEWMKKNKKCLTNTKYDEQLKLGIPLDKIIN